MQTVLVVLTVLISILLIIVVLIQKSKGGGLASNFAGSNQIMGVRRTNDFIEKATWTLAIIILCLSILSSFVGKGESRQGGRLNPNNGQTEQTTAPDFSSTALTSEKAAADAPAAEAPATEAVEAQEAATDVVVATETAAEQSAN